MHRLSTWIRSSVGSDQLTRTIMIDTDADLTRGTDTYEPVSVSRVGNT